MKKRWVASLAAVFVCALTPACGDDGGGGPSGAPVAFEQYCDAYAEMACEVARICDCLEGYSVELCQTYMRMECADEVEQPVNDGRVRYLPNEGGQCLEDLWNVARDCRVDDHEDWPEACDLMLEGLVPAGQGCDGDAECLPGLECYSSQCVDMPGEGQPCLDGSCETDHFCGVDDLCHRYRSVGQPCPEGDYACDDDLYCDGRTDTCAPYLSAGADCAHDAYACDDDLHCSPASQTCRPYPGAGQSCADSGGDCADDLYCDSAEICQPQQGSGAVCAQDEECLSWDCIDNVCIAPSEDTCPF